MSEDLKKAIQSLGDELQKNAQRQVEIKKTINQLSALMGEPPPYSELEVESIAGVINIRPDQFFGKPFAKAAKEFLKMKGRAASAEEVYEGLKKGGFEFTVKDKFQLKSVALSLAKNSTDFVYVKSSNAYGLWEFYPDKKKDREKKRATQEVPEEAVEEMVSPEGAETEETEEKSN